MADIQTFTEQWDVTWYTSHERIRSAYVTMGAGENLLVTLTPETRNSNSRPFRLKEVRLTCNGAVSSSNLFKITLDSVIGSTHDLVILAKNLSGLTTYDYLFDPQRVYGPGDKLILSYTNADGVIMGVELIWCTGS